MLVRYEEVVEMCRNLLEEVGNTKERYCAVLLYTVETKLVMASNHFSRWRWCRKPVSE